jgi:hypothetical protein
MQPISKKNCRYKEVMMLYKANVSSMRKAGKPNSSTLSSLSKIISLRLANLRFFWYLVLILC